MSDTEEYIGPKFCFIPRETRMCMRTCMAYVDEGKTNCRLLNALEKLVPAPTRPVAPPPPKVNS